MKQIHISANKSATSATASACFWGDKLFAMKLERDQITGSQQWDSRIFKQPPPEQISDDCRTCRSAHALTSHCGIETMISSANVSGTPAQLIHAKEPQLRRYGCPRKQTQEVRRP